jgi:hypothetical protein
MTAKQFYGAALALAMVGLVANVAWASEGDRMVYGAGMETSAVWQQSGSRNTVATLQFEAWIDGFFSGYNTASEGTDFIAPKPAADGNYPPPANPRGAKSQILGAQSQDRFSIFF